MVYTVVNTSGRSDEEEPTRDEGSSRSTNGFWSMELELQAMKTILTPSSEWSAKVYSVCKLEFFHHSTTRAVFTRLQSLMSSSRTFELPTLDFVLSDAKISPTVRQALSEAFEGSGSTPPVSMVKSQGDFDILVQGLTSLAKTRALYHATHQAASELLDSDDPTLLMKEVTDKLGESLFTMDDDDELLAQITMGKGYNQAAEDSFTRIVRGTFEQQKIKTGFREFDERTGGFHRTNLVILGANSGGGKSLMAVNLLIRQYRLGYSTILCSYEMTDDEVMIRLLSNISEVDMNRLQNNKITPEEIDRLTAAWREFNIVGHEKSKAYHIICPKTETTVPEIGFRVRSMKPDVLILDYINLLSSASGTQEAQWQALGNISREAKLLANKLNCVVILLAQIDDTYNLRYSKAIKDHANFVMSWIRDEDARNTRVVVIKQQKARNAPVYDWDLHERFDIAQFRDPEQQDRADWPTRDELLMLELRCQSLGLKLEPSVSREFDKDKMIRAAELRAKKIEVGVEISPQVSDISEDEDSKKIAASLLYSSTDVKPIDFSKIPITAVGADSLLIRDNPLFEDTV